jgi:hypothetical protein
MLLVRAFPFLSKGGDKNWIKQAFIGFMIYINLLNSAERDLKRD